VYAAQKVRLDASSTEASEHNCKLGMTDSK